MVYLYHFLMNAVKCALVLFEKRQFSHKSEIEFEQLSTSVTEHTAAEVRGAGGSKALAP